MSRLSVERRRRNNHDIQKNNKLVFCKHYNTSGIRYISDLRFDLSSIDSFNIYLDFREVMCYLQRYPGPVSSIPIKLTLIL